MLLKTVITIDLLRKRFQNLVKVISWHYILNKVFFQRQQGAWWSSIGPMRTYISGNHEFDCLSEYDDLFENQYKKKTNKKQTKTTNRLVHFRFLKKT